MPNFMLKVELDNDDFMDSNQVLADLLAKTAEVVGCYNSFADGRPAEGILADKNGNTVGSWMVIK